MSRIVFAGSGRWVAFSQDEMSYWAADPTKGKLSVRILFAAMGRQNSLGHAQFGCGELARILGKFDPETGTITPARRDTVSRAISEAKASGYIDPRSTSGCLLVFRHAFTKESRDRFPCKVHPHG